MEGEGRKGSCSHRHDLILLGQNLFGFLCARPRRLPAESIIYPVVLFVQRSANQRADGIESGASLTREEEREGRVGQGRSWISRSDKTFHLILDSRFRVYILSSDRWWQIYYRKWEMQRQLITRYSEYVRVHFFYPLECAQARAIRSYSTVSIENEEDGGID